MFDAIVVGSGATGGWAAKTLCERGLRVCVIEAGQHREVGDGRRVSADSFVQRRCYAYNENTGRFFVDDALSPYVHPREMPFSWIRARVVGGKSLLWAGHCYRMSDFDFAAARLDGFGEEWPLHYDDLAPYYAHVEQRFGVAGTLENIPQVPDGVFLPSDPLTAQERQLWSQFEKYGHRVIPARVGYGRRDGAETCVHCGRQHPAYPPVTTSANSTLVDALETGYMTLMTGALVRKVLTNSNGHATGVRVIDSTTRESTEVSARLIFLCASALESTRILLNSTSPAHRAGLGNASGKLGRYIMDHVCGTAVAGAIRVKGRGGPLGRPLSVYVPRWQNLPGFARKPYIRGFALQILVQNARDFFQGRSYACGVPDSNATAPLDVLGNLDSLYVYEIRGFGEMLPRETNAVRIDPNGKTDSWGIPVLEIRCELSENERQIADDMFASSLDLAKAIGGTVTRVQRTPAEPGLAMHESGTCRMGADPRTSVLNQYQQCHDASNVFVCDGSSFPSQGTQNPTLTMMALTIRSCQYAADRLAAGDLFRAAAPRNFRRMG